MWTTRDGLAGLLGSSFTCKSKRIVITRPQKFHFRQHTHTHSNRTGHFEKPRKSIFPAGAASTQRLHQVETTMERRAVVFRWESARPKTSPRPSVCIRLRLHLHSAAVRSRFLHLRDVVLGLSRFISEAPAIKLSQLLISNFRPS